MLEETRPDHAIRSAVTSTKLLLCCVNMKENNKKEKYCFLKNIYTSSKGKKILKNIKRI